MPTPTLAKALDEIPRRSEPAPPEAVRLARELMKQFSECFWSWREDPPLATRDDVYAVVSQLRAYGGQEAWHGAQQLWRCL